MKLTILSALLAASFAANAAPNTIGIPVACVTGTPTSITCRTDGVLRDPHADADLTVPTIAKLIAMGIDPASAAEIAPMVTPRSKSPASSPLMSAKGIFAEHGRRFGLIAVVSMGDAIVYNTRIELSAEKNISLIDYQGPTGHYYVAASLAPPEHELGHLYRLMPLADPAPHVAPFGALIGIKAPAGSAK